MVGESGRLSLRQSLLGCTYSVMVRLGGWRWIEFPSNFSSADVVTVLNEFDVIFISLMGMLIC